LVEGGPDPAFLPECAPGVGEALVLDDLSRLYARVFVEAGSARQTLPRVTKLDATVLVRV
jgi:hypothetical protein